MPGPDNRRKTRLCSNGYTLLETTITLLIAGIFLVGIVPGLKRFMAGANLQMAADRLVENIREVQQRALSEQCAQYFILFNRSNGTYYIRKTASPEAVTIAVVRLPDTVAIENTNFDDNKLLISAKGLPWPRGGTITLRDKGTARFKYVIIASITGRVRSSDQPPESWEISP